MVGSAGEVDPFPTVKNLGGTISDDGLDVFTISGPLVGNHRYKRPGRDLEVYVSSSTSFGVEVNTRMLSTNVCKL